MNYDSPSMAISGIKGANGAKVDQRGGPITEVIKLKNLTVALADNPGVVAYLGVKVGTFPAGSIVLLGALADLDITKSSAGVNDDWDGDISLGTVTANNGATLATTEQNLIPTTPTPQAVAGVTTGNMAATATEVGAVHDGTSSAIAIYLNCLIDDADHNVAGTACNLIFNGTITVTYALQGDY